MHSRVLTLVRSWLVIDFFSESRRTGEPGSSLTTTVFGQSFFSLIFAAVFLPDSTKQAVAYLAANLSLSTILIGIGLLGDPKGYKRELADEFLVHTSPMPAGSLALARAIHSSFYIALVTTGMAIPPAVLAYWVCGQSLTAVALYLVMATAAAGIMAASLALITQFVHLMTGPLRAQLLIGTLKMLLLGGGFAGFARCLPHLSDTADQLPIGRLGAMFWPPYWGARIIDQPGQSILFWQILLGTGAALFLAASALNRMRRRRLQPKPARYALLARMDRWFVAEGPLLGVVRFVATMLYRSPGFRARVLPIFGMPAAMVVLSLWANTDDHQGRTLLLGVTLQFPAIFLPFLIAFLPRSDHEHAGWIFETSPHQEIELYRTASLVALTTHILVPVQLTACAALLLASGGNLNAILFAISMPVFSLAVATLVGGICMRQLRVKPFTEGGPGDGALEFGGLLTTAILLTLGGGSFSLYAGNTQWPHQLASLALACGCLGLVLIRLRSRCATA